MCMRTPHTHTHSSPFSCPLLCAFLDSVPLPSLPTVCPHWDRREARTHGREGITGTWSRAPEGASRRDGAGRRGGTWEDAVWGGPCRQGGRQREASRLSRWGVEASPGGRGFSRNEGGVGKSSRSWGLGGGRGPEDPGGCHSTGMCFRKRGLHSRRREQEEALGDFADAHLLRGCREGYGVGGRLGARSRVGRDMDALGARGFLGALKVGTGLWARGDGSPVLRADRGRGGCERV